MPDEFAIRLKNVSKIYRLYGSQGDQLIDVLGLQRFGFRPKKKPKEFAALRNISLAVPRGHRVGIVGRNGAGKTTLLKLICGNFTPSTGEVEVNGGVQALMSVGLGFHPDYTGRENVEGALQYNGLSRLEYGEAMEGIIDFCELGDFLDQPFKTYSLGMQARLMFAAATAIRPEILIVDEVLGAGDAYFVAKSKARVEKLVSSGCTMLLVSHSMQQVLELCDEAIWMDQGEIRMQGESFLVVKAYEEYLHGPNKSVEVATKCLSNSPELSITEVAEEDVNHAQLSSFGSRDSISIPQEFLQQEPVFIPHREVFQFLGNSPSGFQFVAPGGVSRWAAESSLKVQGFTIVTERGYTNKLVSMRPARFILSLVGEVPGHYRCRYGIAFHNHLGACVSRIFSPCDDFEIEIGGERRFELTLNPLQLGPGEYTVGISVTEYSPIEKINEARRYDLISRSFQIMVELPGSLNPIGAEFFHTGEWKFGN